MNDVDVIREINSSVDRVNNKIDQQMQNFQNQLNSHFKDLEKTNSKLYNRITVLETKIKIVYSAIGIMAITVFSALAYTFI